VCAGEDFALANPDPSNLTVNNQVTFYQPQFGELEEQAGDLESADADLTTAETKPVDTPVETSLGVALNQADETDLIYFGDPITSIRQILKRYCTWRTSARTNTVAQSGTWRKRASDFPLYSGYTGAGALDNAASPVDPTPYTYAAMTMLNWFTPCFLCRRGGIRWKYMWRSDGVIDGPMSVVRQSENDSLVDDLWYSYDQTTQSAAAYAASVGEIQPSSHSGAHYTHTSQNPVLEVELPFYSNYRFYPARVRKIETSNDWLRVHELRSPVAASKASYLTSMCAAGEDYNLCFFQSVPTFFVGTWPAPSATL
jgi:hypothetical protein